jgi:hypothetical protein
LIGLFALVRDTGVILALVLEEFEQPAFEAERLLAVVVHILVQDLYPGRRHEMLLLYYQDNL